MPKLEMSDPISLRLPIDILSEVDSIAHATERTRSWVVVRALRRYLASEGADILAAIEGRDAVARGEGVAFDVVLGEIEAVIKAGRAA